MTMARPTPVSMDRNHQADGSVTEGNTRGVSAIRVQRIPMTVTTAPARSSRSPGAEEGATKPP